MLPQVQSLVSNAALRELPADEVAVFQYEVDINLNPKIGPMWMRRGQQAEVATPGDNHKRYLAGSINWRTGTLWTTEGKQRDGKLFVRHVDGLRRRLRRYKKIHVICDNAAFHWNCWDVWEFVHRYGDRVVLHFLPTYAPECNPIERVWENLHAEVTRNHTCPTMDDLMAAAHVHLWIRYFRILDRAAEDQPLAQAS